MKYNVDVYKFFYLMIFSAYLIELSIGGNGQMFKLYGIPVRQLIFSIIIFIFICNSISGKKCHLVSSSSLIIFSILCWLLVSAIIGLIRGHDVSLIAGDMKPMLCFLLYRPLFNLISVSRISISSISKIFIFSAFFLSMFSLVVYFLIHFNIFGDRVVMQKYLDEVFGSGNIRTRANGSVVHDSLIYVIFGFGFCYSEFLNKKNKISYLVLIITFMAVIFSLSKGLIISIIISALFITIKNLKKLLNIKIISLLFLPIIFLTILSFYSLDMDRLSYRNISTDKGMEIRGVTYNQSMEVISKNPIIGAGFGQKIDIRPAHIENSYLDIIMEQGVIGLILYLVLIFHILTLFRTAYIKAKDRKYLIDAFGGGFFALLFLSCTNPYINNPLGISYLLILLVVLECLGGENAKKNCL